MINLPEAMDKQNSSRSRASSAAATFFVVAPRSPLGKVVAGVLALGFAVSALMMFGIILAGALVLAMLGALTLMVRRPKPDRERRIGRVIDGEHTILSIDEASQSPLKHRR